ncbi:metal-dependent hydrolase [Candidatus Pacearchaeota archaeon]|nr:metal-dependent hydrolase [Candidatus Pacearchaeota archaeon]
MLFKTHFALSIFFILLMFVFVDNKIGFIIFALIGFVIPDMDSKYSKFGRNIFFRPLQFFLKHRGFFHSLTFGFLMAVVLGIFFPIASLGFFIGFSSHIIGDSFTIEGIAPFWPLKKRSYGFIETGSFFESIVFYSLVFIDTLLLILLLFF